MSDAVLASWNDGKAKAAILDFVKRGTTKGSNFVPPADRIRHREEESLPVLCGVDAQAVGGAEIRRLVRVRVARTSSLPCRRALARI